MILNGRGGLANDQARTLVDAVLRGQAARLHAPSCVFGEKTRRAALGTSENPIDRKEVNARSGDRNGEERPWHEHWAPLAGGIV